MGNFFSTDLDVDDSFPIDLGDTRADSMRELVIAPQFTESGFVK